MCKWNRNFGTKKSKYLKHEFLKGANYEMRKTKIENEDNESLV